MNRLSLISLNHIYCYHPIIISNCKYLLMHINTIQLYTIIQDILVHRVRIRQYIFLQLHDLKFTTFSPHQMSYLCHYQHHIHVLLFHHQTHPVLLHLCPAHLLVVVVRSFHLNTIVVLHSLSIHVLPMV